MGTALELEGASSELATSPGSRWVDGRVRNDNPYL